MKIVFLLEIDIIVFHFIARIYASAVLAVSLSACPSVMGVLCDKTSEPILPIV